jgi:hypothetical protein
MLWLLDRRNARWPALVQALLAGRKELVVQRFVLVVTRSGKITIGRVQARPIRSWGLG